MSETEQQEKKVRYIANAGSFNEALSQLLDTFKAQNPGIDKYNLYFGDGSKVSIQLRKKKR